MVAPSYTALEHDRLFHTFLPLWHKALSKQNGLFPFPSEHLLISASSFFTCRKTDSSLIQLECHVFGEVFPASLAKGRLFTAGPRAFLFLI